MGIDTDKEKICLELLKSINERCSAAAICRSKIARLKLESRKVSGCSSEENKHLSDAVDTSNNNSLFEDEISFYLSDYKLLNGDFTVEDLIKILPSRKNYNFTKIIYRLQAESYKDIKEIKEFMFENDDLSDSDIDGLKTLLSSEKKKIDYLRKILLFKEEEIVTEDVSNEIILVPTISGNIRIIDDLSHIPIEKYDEVLELINSIVDGTFKGVKGFTHINQLSGLVEARKNDLRVLFTRIGEHTYAIISAFVKKVTTDQFYRDSLKRKFNDYHLVEDFIVSNLDNSEFISENDSYIKELYSILKKDTDSKKQYMKGVPNE